MSVRILIIDDLFGRNVPGGRNTDRENLCAHFLWKDVTDDETTRSSRQKIMQPLADAVFFRGQTPISADVGDNIDNDLQGCLAKVREGWTDAFSQGDSPWAMVLLDLCFYTGPVTQASHRRFPGMPVGCPGDDEPGNYFGLTILDAVHREFPELPVYILSSKPREEVSLEFSRRGGLGFIARDDLHAPQLLQEALWKHGLLPDSSGEVVGNSLPVLLALREARRAAAHRGNVLIQGERGTGKELLAAYAHRVATALDVKGDQPFVAVNSALLRTDLFASELFGIEPKTASGVDGKIGLVEAANGGDLFLDEIADMPPEVQAAVLRVLQDKQITRIGARQSKKVEVRFLSATNAVLEADSRGFRADLLDRLRLGGTIWLPPLHERKSDIPLLAERFVREAEAKRLGSLKRTISPEALDRLCAHDWPGNVRELHACLFDAVNRFPDVEHLVPAHLRFRGEHVVPVVEPILAEHSEASLPLSRSAKKTIDIDSWLSYQDQLCFEDQKIANWSGRLPEIQRAQSWALARYLLAALEATKRRTPDHPEGLLQIHPAVRLITGDTNLTASRAADIIKRILGPIERELVGDLREALAIALRLRPRSSRPASLV